MMRFLVKHLNDWKHSWKGLISDTGIRKAFGQPDFTFAILILSYFLFQDLSGYSPTLLWWLLVVVLSAYTLIVVTAEYNKTKLESLLYRGRGIISWGMSVGLWSFFVALTGGLYSPLLGMIIFTVIFYTRNPRRQRYVVSISILILSVLLSFAFRAYFPQLLAPPLVRPILLVFIVWCVVLISGYCAFFAEFRSFEIDYFSSAGEFWTGFEDEYSFLRAILARAMRLYQADWGFVARRGPSFAGEDLREEKDSSKTTHLKVLLRIGQGTDDPISEDDEEARIPDDHIAYIAEKKGTKIHRSRKPMRLSGIPGVFHTEFSFVIRRFQTKEIVGVFTVLSKKWLDPLFPSSTPYLAMLTAQAENTYEMFIYMSSYRNLLLANDENFSEELNRICNRIVPLSARPVSIQLSLSNLAKFHTDFSDALMPAFFPLDEGRETPRYITAAARFNRENPSDIVAVSKIYQLLQDVSQATYITQKVRTTETIKASDKGLIGLSDLEPPTIEFTDKIREWEGGPFDIFENCGFRLLWANQLMYAWYPGIREDEDSPKKYRKFCYKYFNSDKQNRPCYYCPCLLLYSKFLKAVTDDERNKIISSVEVGPSHSPAGKMRIYRHFELGASLIPNLLLPEHPSIEDRVSFIRETVIDRTLEVEVLFIIIKTATQLEKFVGDLDKVTAINTEEQKNVVDKMFNIVAEGLGRTFQANHVCKIDLSNGTGKIEAEYVCKAAHATEAQCKELADNERQVIDNSCRRDSMMANIWMSVPDYFENRAMLFTPRLAFVGTNLSDEISEQFKKAKSSKYSLFGVREIQKKDNPDFFSGPFKRDDRCLMILVPPTESVLAILTSGPEDWERSSPGGELLPRYPEMELCQCVCEMLGHFLESLRAANQYATKMITKKVRELTHEMGKVFSTMSLDTGQIRRLIQTEVTDLIYLMELIKKYDLVGLATQWHHLLEEKYKHPRTFSAELIRELCDSYIGKICNSPDTRDGINYAIFEKLTESGIVPDNLNGIEKLRKVPPQERSELLSFLGNLVYSHIAIMHIDDADDFVQNVYESILARRQVVNLDIPASIERIIRLVGHKLPTNYVNVKVPEKLVVEIDKPAFYTIVKNFLSNAIEATLREECTEKEVSVLAYLDGRSLIVEVYNPPPLITSDIEELYKYGVSTKEGDGYGIGLYLAKEAAERTGSVIRYNVKNGCNCFTAIFPYVRIVNV